MKLLSKKAFAAEEGVSPSMVSKWVRYGLPVEKGGKVNPDKARAWLADNCERPGDSESLTSARARAASLLADLRTLELKQKQGELVEVSKVQEEWGSIVRGVRNRFLSFPSQMAPRLTGDVRQNHTMLTAEIRRILLELAGEIRSGTKVTSE